MRGGLGLRDMTSPLRTPPAAGPVGSGPVDYGGRRFRPVGDPGVTSVDSTAVDSTAVEGLYHQDGDLVWAEFAGGAVRAGRLVGTRRPDGVLDAAYCFVTATGETVAGACVSTPRVLADGRLRLSEHWRRLDGSSGVSHVEEVRG